MKSLKKLATVAALLSAMNFAKAESKEVQYAPTDYEGGEIDKIELVNGNVLVRSNGKFNGFEMPFAYTGTNTQDFASRAFAQGGATNVTQYVHAGNGKIYMTFNGVDGIYTTQIGKEFGPGVVEVDVKDPQTKEIKKYAIRSVEGDELNAAQALLDADKNNDGRTAVVDGHVYTYEQNDKGEWTLFKDGKKSTEDFIGGSRMNEDGATPEQILFADANAEGTQKILYVLATDNSGVKRIYTADGSLNRKEVDYLTMVDGKLMYQDHNTQEVKVYNPSAKSNDPSKEKTVNTSAIPANAKSVVVAGNNIYYATAKKLGVRTMD